MQKENKAEPKKYIKHGAYNEEMMPDNLQHAEPRRPRFEKIIANGKTYIDVTELYLQN